MKRWQNLRENTGSCYTGYTKHRSQGFIALLSNFSFCYCRLLISTTSHQREFWATKNSVRLLVFDLDSSLILVCFITIRVEMVTVLALHYVPRPFGSTFHFISSGLKSITCHILKKHTLKPKEARGLYGTLPSGGRVQGGEIPTKTTPALLSCRFNRCRGTVSISPRRRPVA